MKKSIYKKVLISIIIVTLTLLILLLTNVFTNNEAINQIMPKILRQEKEIIVDGISCKVLDNTGEKIKAFVTITRGNGIEKIEYLASNEKNMVLNCNNKQKVTMDIEILVDEEQQFKVTSNGEEKIETVRLNENYIDDYIKITKLDNEEEHDQVDIEFTPVQASLNYYKINNGSWVAYSSILSLSLSDIDIENLQNGGNETTIYAKSVDFAGNTLVSSKTIELTKKYPDFDLFHNMDISGKTNLGEYGISGYWNYAHSNSSAHRNFSVRNMGVYLRQGGKFNYSASFTISNISAIKPIKASQLYFTAYHRISGYYNTSYSSATIYYTDGTYTSSSTNTLNGYAGQINDIGNTFANNTNLQDKPIDRIVFNISGHYNNGGLHTNITGIVLKGIK